MVHIGRLCAHLMMNSVKVQPIFFSFSFFFRGQLITILKSF